MLVKLALGNVRRSVHDFSVYFLTLALAACLLYSFLASTDYLLALDLTAEQRAHFVQAGGVLQAFAVFVVVSFAVPGALSCVHCIFGFALIGMLTLMSGAVGFMSFAAGTLAFTVVTFALYYAVTARTCVRALLPRALA